MHPQDVCQEVCVPQDGSCPPGCARGCAMIPRIHLACAVCSRMCPKCCASQLLPSALPAGVTRVFPTGGGCTGCCIIVAGGCGTLDPPVSSRAGWGCTQGGERTVPTAPLQKEKRLILLPGHPGVSTWGRAESLLAPVSRCQRSVVSAGPALTGCGHLGPFSRSHICPVS